MKNKNLFKKKKKNISDKIINTTNILLDNFLIALNILSRNNSSTASNNRVLIVYCLMILSEKKIIETDIIWIKEKTYRRYYLKTPILVYDKNLDISFNKFNKFVFNGIKYIYSQHYSNLNKLFKENKRSNKTFNLNENDNVLNNLFENGYYLDNNMLHKILLEYSREYDISLQHAEDSYKIILKNLLNSIKNKNKDEISNFSKLLSKFIHILRIKKICDLNIKTKIRFTFYT